MYVYYYFSVNSFYTGIGQIVDDTVSEELNNDNEKTEVSTCIIRGLTLLVSFTLAEVC